MSVFNQNLIETVGKIISFAIVQIKSFHIKLVGFVLMLGLMVFLNNQIEKSERRTNPQTESVIKVLPNDAGIAPLSAQIPDKSEGSLPIKLISNLNSNFLYFINIGYDFRSLNSYIFQKKLFLTFCHKIQKQQMIKYLISAKNKDIQ